MALSIARFLLLALPLAIASPAPKEAVTSCSPASAALLQRVKNKFDSSGVVPVLISSIDPTLLVHVAYPDKNVKLGNKFKTPQTLSTPKISLTPEAGQPTTTTYSLFFINPDNPEPSPPAGVRSPFLHWQVSGLQPACSGSTATPTTVEAYIPCFPPSVDDARYTFLVYREPAGFTPALVNSTVRANFDPTAYAAQTGLTLVGGNFLREGQKNNIPPT